MDLTPLRGSRPFRRLFASQAVTLLGSQATQVALLFQAKELTGSTLAVGLIGVAELVPIVFFALYGGLLADRLGRRPIARLSEAGGGPGGAAPACPPGPPGPPPRGPVPGGP